VRHIAVEERRARLGRRHRLAPGCRAAGAVEAARSVVALHGTDPATVHLSVWARVGEGFTVADMERALYQERSLVKHLAMRRTLFVFPRETLGAAQAGASERVAAAERRRLIREVERGGLHRDGERWLANAQAQVLAALAGGREATSSELRAEIPLLDDTVTIGQGKWGGPVAVGPRVLTILSAGGSVVRASNAAVWTASRPRWATMRDWLGHDLEPPNEAEGVARLVEAWLRAFGPGTLADIRWWLGSTVTAVRRALADVEAVEVDLDGGIGYVLQDDLERTGGVEPWAALLPPLDPTTMGWYERDWYLGTHRAQLFDVNGNAGPTAWCDGRIVGGWRQTADGDVELQLLEDVGADATGALEREADRLTRWLAGTRALPRFPSPLSRTATGP
jgi:winged helix DNA-binding protein